MAKTREGGESSAAISLMLAGQTDRRRCGVSNGRESRELRARGESKTVEADLATNRLRLFAEGESAKWSYRGEARDHEAKKQAPSLFLSLVKMKPCLILLLVGITLSSTLAANVHGDQGHAEEHRVVRRGILEKISSAARSLRDEASSFFERSWAGLKGALTEFLNWMRGISPPKDDHAHRPPPVLPPADLPEGPHQYYPGWEPTNVGDSKDPPTVHPSRYSPSATSPANAGDSHSTPETTRQQATTSTDASGVISHRAGSPNTEDTSSATQTPSLATSTSPEATKTVGPSEASTEPRVESTTERVVSTSGEVVVTAGATSTSTETVSKSTAAEDRGSTAKVDSSTPAILATRDPKLPDEVDESENDIDLPPPRPPAQPKRTNGGGYVISDAR